LQIFAVKDEALLTSRVDGLWLKFINVWRLCSRCLRN
ncbi:hypothetical protein T02_2113, partial [Trichinella nativa]